MLPFIALLQVELGVLTEAEAEECISVEFNPGKKAGIESGNRNAGLNTEAEGSKAGRHNLDGTSTVLLVDYW